MRHLPLTALRALALVYVEGGVRAAARELGIAHSSVSRHLKELEGWLGLPLRSPGRGDGRRFGLNPDGVRLARAVRDGFEGVESVVAALREPRAPGSIAIGTRPSVAVRWLLPRLPALEREHPSLEVSVIVEKRLDDLEASGLDLAIRMGDDPGPGRTEQLADDALYPVMSPEAWRRAGSPSTPEGLVGLRLLHDRDPQATWAVWRREIGPRDLDVRAGPRFTSTDLVLRAAAQGQGVALARHRLAADDLASGALLRPLGALAVPLAHGYWLAVRRGSPSAVAIVVAWLRRQVALQSSV